MICEKCKADVPDNSKFCLQCGAAQGVAPAPTPVVKYKTPGWVPFVVILCAALLIYVIAHNYADAQTAIAPRAGVVGSAPALVRPLTLTTAPITNGALTINAASYSWYKFDVPPGASTVSVLGHYTATGGTGNDIIVYVLDSDSFVNFQNGHPARTFFNSGKMTTGAIGAVLPSVGATYYLLFDNRFSLITPKAVVVDATLHYMQ